MKDVVQQGEIGGTIMKRQYYVGLSLTVTLLIIIIDQLTN